MKRGVVNQGLFSQIPLGFFREFATFALYKERSIQFFWKQVNKIRRMKTKIDPYTDTDDGRLFSLIEQGDEGAFTHEDRKEAIVKMK